MEALQNRIREMILPCLNTQLMDRASVLDDKAVRLARDLWTGALSLSPTIESVSMEIISTIAFLHWCRYQVKPDIEGRNDLQVAAGMFARLHAARPEQIPDGFQEIASTDGYMSVEDSDGAYAFEPFSYLSRTYPTHAPKIHICEDLPVDVTSNLNLDPSDPRTLWMLTQAYNVSFHVTSRHSAREMFSRAGLSKFNFLPASAFHVLAASSFDREKVCFLQAVNFDDLTQVSLVYTGEGEMGFDTAKWVENIMLQFSFVANITKGHWEIGELPNADRMADMSILPLAAFMCDS